jgi:hypothetical protein
MFQPMEKCLGGDFSVVKLYVPEGTTISITSTGGSWSGLSYFNFQIMGSFSNEYLSDATLLSKMG